MAEETISKQIEDESKLNSSSNSDAGSYNRYTVNDERTGSSIGELRKRWSKTEGSVMIGITSSNKK